MSSYLESVLRPGEKIIYQARLSRFFLVFYSLLGIMCLPLLGFLALEIIAYLGKFDWAIIKGPFPSEIILPLFLVLLFSGTFAYIFVKYLYDYFKTEIAVTDQRIIGRAPRALAAFSLKPLDLPLSGIERVYLSITFISSGSVRGLLGLIAVVGDHIIDALVKCGTVVVVDNEGRETSLRAVALPKELERQINEAVQAVAPAAPRPAAGGVAERTLGRGLNWRPIVGWTGAALLIGAALYAYYDTKLQSGKSTARAPAAKASTSRAPAAKAPAPKEAATAADYVQQALQEKDPQQKIALYTKALELDPKNAVAYNNRGYIYYTQKDLDRALRDLDQAIALNPGFALAYHMRGDVYVDQKKYDEAIASYSRAIALKPDFAAAYNGRGNAFFRQQNFDQAIKDYTRTIELKPADRAAFSNRGTAFFQKKDYDEALQDYNQAIKLSPDYYWLYYRRALIYNLKGDTEHARRDYNQAKSLNPKTPDLVIK